MSLSAIAPTEKFENFIYTIFPLSLGIAVAQLVNARIEESIGFIGLVTAFGAIALYELGIDELLVKRWYRLRSNFVEIAFQRSMLSLDTYMRKWNSNLPEPPSGQDWAPTLENNVDKLVQSVVSSYAIRRRLWRIRASFYLFCSMPCLQWTIVHYLQTLTWSSWVTTIEGIQFPFFVPVMFLLVMLYVLAMSFPLQIATFIFASLSLLTVNAYRYRHIRHDIKYLCLFRYLQQVMRVDEFKFPKEYLESQPKGRIKANLDSLDSTVARDDWSTFISNFQPIASSIEHDGRVGFTSNLLRNIVVAWIRYLRKNTSENARTLGWVLYYAYEACQLSTVKVEELKRAQSRIRRLAYRVADWRLEHKLQKDDRLMWGVSDPSCVLIKPLYLTYKEDARIVLKSDSFVLPELGSFSKLVRSVPCTIIDNQIAKPLVKGIGLLLASRFSEEQDEEKIEGLWKDMNVRKAIRTIAQRIANNSVRKVHREILSRILLRYSRQLYEKDEAAAVGIWDGRYNWSEGRLGHLFTCLKRADEERKTNDRLIFLVQFLRENHASLSHSALVFGFWQDELRKGLAREFLISVYRGNEKVDSTFINLVKQLINDENWPDV